MSNDDDDHEESVHSEDHNEENLEDVDIENEYNESRQFDCENALFEDEELM